MLALTILDRALLILPLGGANGRNSEILALIKQTHRLSLTFFRSLC